jgi:hypothetical protein
VHSPHMHATASSCAVRDGGNAQTFTWSTAESLLISQDILERIKYVGAHL